MNAQTIVAANVAARGYMAGWTREQFVARQIAKLTEELSEAAKYITLSSGADWGALDSWLAALQVAGSGARDVFDERAHWEGMIHVKSDTLRAELADMQVVLFAAAAALEFDIAQAAIEKSAADVARGVR